MVCFVAELPPIVQPKSGVVVQIRREAAGIVFCRLPLTPSKMQDARLSTRQAPSLQVFHVRSTGSADLVLTERAC